MRTRLRPLLLLGVLTAGSALPTAYALAATSGGPAAAQDPAGPPPPVVVVDGVERDEAGGVALVGRLGFGEPAGEPGAAVPVRAGMLDPGYGEDGTASLTEGGPGIGVDVLGDDDGSALVLAATASAGSAVATSATVTALDPHGQVDPSYGVDGRYVFDDVEHPFEPAALVPRPSGGTLVVGTGTSEGEPRGLILALTVDGAVDEAYAEDGIAALGGDGLRVELFGGATVPDGAVVVGSITTAGDDTRLLYTPVDDRGVAGVAQEMSGADLDLAGQAAATQADGATVVTGTATDPDTGQPVGYPLFRFLPDGTPDPDFDDGVLRDPAQHCRFSMGSVVIQGDDNVVAGSGVGCDGQGGGSLLMVARQLPDGTADLPFGAPVDDPSAGEGAIGRPDAHVAASRWAATDVSVDDRSRLVVVGTSQRTPAGLYPDPGLSSDWPRPLVLRLLPGGQDDTSFAASAVPLVDFPVHWSLEAVAVLPDQAALVAGTQVRDGVDVPVVSRVAGVGPASVVLSYGDGRTVEGTIDQDGTWAATIAEVLDPGTAIEVTFTDSDGRTATAAAGAPDLAPSSTSSSTTTSSTSTSSTSTSSTSSTSTADPLSPSTTKASSSLPATGGSPTAPVAVAVGLVVGGAVFVALADRARRRS